MRVLNTLTAICLFAGLYSAPVASFAQDPLIVRADSLRDAWGNHPGLGKPVVHRLSDDVYAVEGLYHSSGEPGVNAGIVFANDNVVFVDCGMSVISGEFLWAIAATRMSGDERVIVVLTHHHSDHVFGMSVFADRGAKFIAHQTTAWFLRERGSQYKAFIANMEGWTSQQADSILGDVALSEPHMSIEEDYVLDLAGTELHVLVTPGHVPSELAVYHPTTATLFAGDALYEGMPPTTQFGGPEEWRAWIRQLERLSRLQIRSVVPGHGGLSTGAMLDDNIAHLSNLLREPQ